MKTYYLSLVRGLIGYYVVFQAEHEQVVIKHAKEYFGRIWCDVYEEIPEPYNKTAKIVNEGSPIVLVGSDWE